MAKVGRLQIQVIAKDLGDVSEGFLPGSRCESRRHTYHFNAIWLRSRAARAVRRASIWNTASFATAVAALLLATERKIGRARRLPGGFLRFGGRRYGQPVSDVPKNLRPLGIGRRIANSWVPRDFSFHA